MPLRLQRWFAGLALCLMLETPMALADGRFGGDKIKLRVKPATVARTNEGMKNLGKLKWRGGISIASRDKRFGGFSGLEISADGKVILASSDQGWWLSTSLHYEDGHLADASMARLSPLLTKKGKRAKKKSRRDAESLATYDHRKLDGPILVGFERRERVERFNLHKKGFDAKPKRIKSPKAISSGKNNGELETVARIWQGPLKGWLIAVSETTLDNKGNIRAWRWKKSKTIEFTFKRHDDFYITDIALLPDNREFVTIERSFEKGRWPGMAMRRFKVADLKAGKPVTGELLFEARQPLYAIDNMEGIAIHQTNGETRVTIISDDNYNRLLQSTYIYQFALD